DKRPLFAVQPGIRVTEALDSAYSLLDIAESLTLQRHGAKDAQQAQVDYACNFLISAAKATLQACIESPASEAPAA
ncbi:MAG: DUF3077 domain-containing protein, partial [Pseudomonas sp.]|uniref:DUF3077 domain-containing protein n=1 Tax=Pseudomonas sp. TaxID=306 RepID=UPI0030F30C90